MEPVEILHHSGQPRTEYFLEIPWPLGKLRLDLYAPVSTALSEDAPGPEDLQAYREEVVEALSSLDNGDTDSAVGRLQDLVKQHPYYAPAYGVLADVYAQKGDSAAAEYSFKQLLALDPGFGNIMLYARFLGRSGRLEEARVLQEYLWEQHLEAPQGMAQEAVHDYLVTLSRIPEPRIMMSVCLQAMSEYKGDSTLIYQWIYAYVLDGQAIKALDILNQELPKISTEDPLLPRFEEMRRVALDLAQG